MTQTQIDRYVWLCDKVARPPYNTNPLHARLYDQYMDELRDELHGLYLWLSSHPKVTMVTLRKGYLPVVVLLGKPLITEGVRFNQIVKKTTV